jgi:hypothetical protein
MSTQKALDSKRKYVQSLTGSAMLRQLLMDELNLPDHHDDAEHTQKRDKHMNMGLHFHFDLPKTDDAAVYDAIFAALKRHFT